MLRLGRLVTGLETLAAAEAAGLQMIKAPIDLSVVAAPAGHGEHCAAFRSVGKPWMLASGAPLKTVLGQLVKTGTITQSQATAVTSAFTQQISAYWGDGPGWRDHGRKGSACPAVGCPPGQDGRPLRA